MGLVSRLWCSIEYKKIRGKNKIIRNISIYLSISIISLSFSQHVSGISLPANCVFCCFMCLFLGIFCCLLYVPGVSHGSNWPAAQSECDQKSFTFTCMFILYSNHGR